MHKRRLKDLREPAYTIDEAERAAGLGREGKRSATVADSEAALPEVEMA